MAFIDVSSVASEIFQFVTAPVFKLRFSESSSSLLSIDSVSDSDTEEIPYTKSPLDDSRGCATTVRKNRTHCKGFQKCHTAQEGSHAVTGALAKAVSVK